MSDEASGEEERFVILQGPAGMTEEEYGRLGEAVNEALPEDMSALLIRGEVSTLSREELANTLEATLMDMGEEHRLAGAEPDAHRLAGAEPAEQPADPPWEDEDVEQFKEDMEDGMGDDGE